MLTPCIAMILERNETRHFSWRSDNTFRCGRDSVAFKKMKEDFGEIEKALYQTKNRSNQDPLNFPIRLTNKLAHLNSLVGLDDFPPTDQDVAVKNELTNKINAELATFEKLVDDEMKAFNDEFNALGLSYLSVED